MKSAKIIAIEGIDGSGKTVQINLLKNHLQKEGYRVKLQSFPDYESFFGLEIGQMLAGSRAETSADKVDPKSMSLWYAMDRWQAFQQIKLNEADFILLNRFTLSNAVFQSARVPEEERKKFIDWVFQLEHEQLGLPKPNLYLIFDVHPSNSKENVANKGHRDYIGEAADVYEQLSWLQEYARTEYIRIAKEQEQMAIVECISEDGKMKEPELIHTQVLQQLKKAQLLP